MECSATAATNQGTSQNATEAESSNSTENTQPTMLVMH